MFRIEAALAGPHPVYVAPYGVDLAVVRDVAVRVRELPATQGVRREPLVDERYRARERRIPEVGIEPRQLPALQEPLVDDRLRGEADDVAGVRVLDGLVQPTPDDVELPLECRLVPNLSGYKELPDARHDAARDLAHRLGHHGHVPEAEEILALLGADLLEPALAAEPPVIPRLEEHPHPVASCLGKLDA